MRPKKEEGRDAVIVLAMHGAPPNDFPNLELSEFMGLHAELRQGKNDDNRALRSRYKALETKMLAWPRTAQNDPFCAGSKELARHLHQKTGLEVIVAFNEFCAPTLDEAFDQAAKRTAEKIIVLTPMMTPGGEHSAVEIPAAIRRAQQRHPEKKFIYAWPFATEDVAGFLASEVARFLDTA